MKEKHVKNINNGNKIMNLKIKFNSNPSDANTSLLVDFCNDANYYPGMYYENILNNFQYFWDPQQERFQKREKSNEMLQEELEICKNFLVLLEKIVRENNFLDQIKSKEDYLYSELFWLILYKYLAYTNNPNPLKILFTMLYSPHCYSDDQLIQKLKEVNHYWIYSLQIYLKYDIIDGDYDVKGELIDLIKDIL
ncbi:hypothetical protein LCGC14_1216200 [marine sediment metagenome]|uniref:Uncharacterized protein n=1 Tax=marine sediment metagenome TaxID=412755 RepID=A0A0F9PH62_9ZZZZ